MAPNDIRDEMLLLDGAMFPAFLPGVSKGSTFVFADTLGFHCVGMVADNDKEPKAALAILTRALGDAEASDSVPTIGRQSSQILGDEILKYVRCHNDSRFLQIHALRAGDGLTVARSLGHVQQSLQVTPEIDVEEIPQTSGPSFVLELYPSQEQRVVAGRFIAEAREKRRTGAGVLAEDDRWMLESFSLPGGISLPRLRWARKESDPSTAAHLAVAVIFDEAHRAARLTLIPTMAKECRKYGISLVLASQEARDFHASLYSAIANYLVLRVTETDAKVLVRNVSSSDQERTLIDKIKQMEKFRALYFTERQKKPSSVALLPE